MNSRWIQPLLLLMLPSAFIVEADAVDVFILAGQSNMEGNALLSELPDIYKKTYGKVFFWDGNTFENLTPGKTVTSKPAVEFGPEILFGDTLTRLDPERMIYLVKYSASGIALHSGWDGVAWKGEATGPGRKNFYPGKSPSDPAMGTAYADWIKTVRAALSHLDKKGVNFRIRAVVWVQGGQDSKNPLSARTYAANLKHLKQRLEADVVRGESVPFLYSQSHPNPLLSERFPDWDLAAIGDQKARADGRSGDPQSIPNAWVVGVDGIGLNGDQVHYDAAGQMVLGMKLATEFLQAENHARELSRRDERRVEFNRIFDERQKRWNARKATTTMSWAERLDYVGVAVNEPGYHVWGCAPAVGADGRIHLVVARWPVEATFTPGWFKQSELAHYVGDSPEGPFRYVKTVLSGVEDDGSGRWGVAPHSPNLQKVGDRYVVTYVANAGAGHWPQGQRIGMLIADDINGPWRKVGDGGIILAPPEDPGIWSHGAVLGMTNPSLLPMPDGRFFLYYKAKRTWAKNDPRRFGVAIADRLEGPYVFLPQPVTNNDRIIEDGHAFIENGKVHLLTTDNVHRTGLMWVSGDGVEFGPPELGYDTMEAYMGEDLVKRSPNYYHDAFEVPQILMFGGHPAYLYAASGSNITGGDGSCSYVFRIRND